MKIIEWLRPKNAEQRRAGFRLIVCGNQENFASSSEVRDVAQDLGPIFEDAENLLEKCRTVFKSPIQIGGPEQKAVSDFKRGCRLEEGACDILISSQDCPDASRELFLAYLNTLVDLRNKATQIRGNLRAIETDDAENLEQALQDLISSLADQNLTSYNFQLIRSRLQIVRQKLGV